MASQQYLIEQEAEIIKATQAIISLTEALIFETQSNIDFNKTGDKGLVNPSNRDTWATIALNCQMFNIASKKFIEALNPFIKL